MSWQLFVGLAVFLYSINALLHRVLMRDAKSDAHAQAIIFNGLTGFYTFILLLFQPRVSFTIPNIGQLPIFLLVIACITLASIMTFKGLKVLEASDHTILLTSSKIWLLVESYVILREPFHPVKLLGAVIILAGVVIAQYRKTKHPTTIGVFYVLLAAFLYASGEVLSFFVIRNFNAMVFMFYISILSTVALIAVQQGALRKLSFYTRPKYGFTILLLCAFDTLATLFVYLTYQAGRNALQIGPLMATQTIVTVVLAYIFLHETDHLLQKIIGTGIVVLGSVLLVS